MPHTRVFVSRGATAFEIFLRGSLPVEPGPGLISRLWRRSGLSTVFGGASYPHESARKSRSFKSHAWIGDLGLFWVISPQGTLPLSSRVRDRVGGLTYDLSSIW